MGFGGIKRTTADDAFSKCVRERNEYTCENCGTQYNRESARGLECSHYIGRSEKSVRLDRRNAFAHCVGCHARIGGNPPRFVQHYRDKFGEAVEIDLIRDSNDVGLGRLMHRAIKDGSAAKHYRQELKRMLEARNDGVTGRLEFTDYREAIGWQG